MEVFYPRKDLIKDLAKFASPAVQELISQLKKEKGETFNEFKLPDYILALLDERATSLYEGDNEYPGLNEETIKQLEAVIQENLSGTFEELISAIRNVAPAISERRAGLIAQTTVSSAIERSRFEVAKNEKARYKRHLGVNDSRETEISKKASAVGVVPINYVYEHKIGDGLAVPLHINDRGTIVYSVFNKSDIT